MHSFNQNLFSMTPYLLFCSLILFSSSPKVFSCSPTLLSSTLIILFSSLIILFSSPILFSSTPKVFSRSPILLSRTLLIISSFNRILLTKSYYQNDETQLYRHTGQLLTLAYSHRLADEQFAGFSPAKS